MKILISESQYDLILNELLLLMKDLERINQNGEDLVEEVEIGPFILILTRNKETGNYQVGLTTSNKEFTTIDSQQDVETEKSQTDIIQSWKKITNKIKEWVDKFSLLFVGSFNHNKVKKYHKILSRFGLNTSGISSVTQGSWFIIRRG